MEFKQLQESKLYQNKDFNNVYTVKDGLLYHVGVMFRDYLEVNMYYVEYKPEFILEMEFKEIQLTNIKKDWGI